MSDPGPVQLPTRSRIGRYQIQKLLGQGGMGEVYKAFDPSLDRTVALKTIVAGTNNPALVERLVREARACGRLQHPGIVMVHDIGDADGVVFIAMEYLEGRNLAEAMSDGIVGIEQTFDTLIQMLDALDYAHSEGVVHRDIKPSNVILLPSGRIKILDFGIARVAKADPLTMTGEVIGTPNYMSPEQMKAHPVDGRTDIYSTGVVGYELLTHRRAFDGETVTAVMLKVLGESAPPMATPVSLACPEIETIIRRAIAKSPDDRYAHARDMADALREVMAEHRDEILRASHDADKTIVNPPRPAAREAAGGTTLRVSGSAPTAPVVPPMAPESTLRVPPAPPSLAPPPPVSAAASGPTIRMGDGPPLTGRARPTVPTNPSSGAAAATGKRATPKWPLAVAALLLAGAVIYFAPRFQSTTGVDAQKPSETAAAPAGAPASPAASPAPVTAVPIASPPPQPQSTAASGAPPARTQASTPAPAPPPAQSAAPAQATAPAQTTTAPPAPPSGPLDAHAVSFATGSDAALATALTEALKEKNITRKPSGARWELVVHDQISVRPSGLGSASALTADYVGDLEIRDRSKGTSENRHFDGHALEFGDPVVRAAAVRALAEKMADELAQVIK